MMITSSVLFTLMACSLGLVESQPSPVYKQNKEDLYLTISAGSQAILVSWKVTLPHVTVTWQDQFDGSGEMVLEDASEAMITNVRPCTTVNVAVYPEGVERPPAAVAMTYTSAKAPPAVHNLEIPNITARSLSLFWERPDIACIITDYTITYSGVAKWGPRTEHTGSATIGRLTANTATSVDIDGLVPCADYTVTVAAATKAGVGVSSSIIGVTQEEEPSKPRDLQNSSLSSSAIFLTWEEPKEVNGIITSYSVRWYENDRSLGEYSTWYPVHTITDLSPCVEYTIQVAAITGAGKGEYQEVTQVTLAAVSIQNAFCTICPDTQEVTVTWFKPETACLITGYELSWQNETEQSFASINAFIAGPSLSYTAKMPSEEHRTVCVAAMLEEERGQRTCCVEIIHSAKSGWCSTLVGVLSALIAASLLSISLLHHGEVLGCKQSLDVLVEYQEDDSEACTRYSLNKDENSGLANRTFSTNRITHEKKTYCDYYQDYPSMATPMRRTPVHSPKGKRKGILTHEDPFETRWSRVYTLRSLPKLS